ncbi:MAG: ABC transporter ATP-binding protein, partial [Pirellulales bacterium]
MIDEGTERAKGRRRSGDEPGLRLRFWSRSKKTLPSLWHVLRYFSPHIIRQRGLVVRSLAALFVSILFRLLEPWPLKFVIDRIIVPKAAPQWERALGLDTLAPGAWLALVAFSVVLITLARATADYASRVGFFVIGNRVVIELRDQVYRHLHTLSLAYHHRARSGDLIIRVTRDVSLLRDVTATAILPLLASVMILFGMVIIMFLLEWRLTLLALSTVPLFSITTLRIGRRIRESARKQRKREGAMAATAAESISAIENVQALSLESLFAESFSYRNRTSQKEDLKANRLSARLGRTIDVLLSVATALVLWYGALLVMRGAMTPGALLVFLTYVKRAFKPAQSFAKYTARLAKAAAAGERVIELLEQSPDIENLPDARSAPRFRGAVCFEDGDCTEGLICQD